jgi:predicted metalloprotease with PDZ domain
VAGRIGSGFLRRYRVLLDPSAGQMLLSPGPEADAPPVRSTSGLLVERQADALVVLHVMKGGPADSAGWRAGERICSVDGVTPPGGDWPAGTPGRTVALGLCGGETRALTLAAFY